MRVAAPRAARKRGNAAAHNIARLAPGLAVVVGIGAVADKRLIGERGKEGVSEPGRVFKAVACRRREVGWNLRAVALLDAQDLEAVLVPFVVFPRGVVRPQEAKLPVPRGVCGVAPIVGEALDRADASLLAPVNLAQGRALPLAYYLRESLHLTEPCPGHVELSPRLRDRAVHVEGVDALKLLADASDVVSRAPVPLAAIVVVGAFIRPVLHDVVQAADLPDADFCRATANVHYLPGVLKRARGLRVHGDARAVLDLLYDKLPPALAGAGDCAGAPVGRDGRADVVPEQELERGRRDKHRPLGREIREPGDLALARHTRRDAELERAERRPFEFAAVAVGAIASALAALVIALDAEDAVIRPWDVGGRASPDGLVIDLDGRSGRLAVALKIDGHEPVVVGKPAPRARLAVATPRADGVSIPLAHKAAAVEGILVFYGILIPIPV